MSLLRQLLLSVTLAMVVILVGVMAVSVDSARQYLDTQLQAQADSTATSLALTLSQPANQDPSVRELLVSALFDSGEFRTVEFLDPAGRILIRRSLDEGAATSASSAPRWFSDFLPLAPHEARRQATNGWTQLGVVRLLANDAYAQDALWKSSMRMVAITLSAGLLWGLFVVGLMRWLRRAIQDDVTARVQAMAGNTVADLPPVRHPLVVELREVSRVIASTHKRVRATAHEREARIESLQFELNQDVTTGLANRKYFINEFRRILEPAGTGQAQGGHAMLFRQCDLRAINQSVSRRVVDQWLRNMAQLVREILHDRLGPEAWLARLNGSDFAFVMPVVPGPVAVRIAQSVSEMLQAQRIQLGHAGLCRWRLALTDYEPGDDISRVLSRLDEALMRAESAGSEDVEYLPGADQQAAAGGRSGEQSWRALLQDALAEGWFKLDVRADGDARPDGRKVGMLMVHEPGAPAPLSGYLFMPPAVRLGLSAACDLRAAELALAWLRNDPSELILRVSLASILQPDFQGYMVARFEAAPEMSARLIVELDAYGLVANRAQVVAFAAALRGHGVRLGLRRFAEQPDALLYLHEVMPEYVRVSGNLLAALDESAGARRLLDAVKETAHDLGAVVDLTAGA